MNKIDFDNSINIFTDASTTTHNGVVVGSAGFIVVVNKCIQYSTHRVLYNVTSNYSEMYAILMAIKYILFIKSNIFNYPIPRINIFSDSEIIIFGLRKWVFSWVNKKKCRSDSFMSEKKTTKEQLSLGMDLFKFVITSIVDNDIHLNLYHTLSHKRYNNAMDLQKIITKFRINNKIKINATDASYLAYYNSFVDNMTRKNLLSITEDPMFETTKDLYKMNNSIISNDLCNDTICRYRNMINKG